MHRLAALSDIAIDGAAAANREISHVERLRLIIRVGPAQREQIMQRYAESTLGVGLQILRDEGRIKAIKPG